MTSRGPCREARVKPGGTATSATHRAADPSPRESVERAPCRGFVLHWVSGRCRFGEHDDGRDDGKGDGFHGRTEPLRRREDRGGGARHVARARRVQRGATAKRRPPPVLLERRAADRQRTSGDPPRPRPYLQGHLPPLQAHAGLPLPAQGGMGHPRPAGRARDREGARDLRQGRDRAPGGGGGVHPPLPRVGDALHRRLGADDRAHGLLGEHGRRLLHPRQLLHRVGVVAASADLGQGPHLPGLQGGALRPAHRRHAFVARGRARVQGGRGPVGLRPVPGRGGGGHVVPGVDHHALDPAVEPGAGRAPRCRLRLRAHRFRVRREVARVRSRGGLDRVDRSREPPRWRDLHRCRGARRSGAGRYRLHRREAREGRRSRRDALHAPVRPPPGRRPDLPSVDGRLRDHRGRHRHRALRAGLR